MPVATTSNEQRVLLRGIRWETYEQLLADLDSPGTRLTYDRGDLEIMTTSHRHEGLKKSLARMVETMTLELGIPLKSGGQTTWKRADLERGLEPDECYWVQSESSVRGRSDLDLTIDPPPDLAIEVEISRSAISRMEIYAALGVGEVWRHDGNRMRIHVLQADGSYSVSRTSRCFRGLDVPAFVSFLRKPEATDETTWMRKFRDWVRETLPRP